MDWDNCFVFSHVDLRLENSVVVHDDIVFIYLWAYDNIVLFLKFETHCLSTPAKQIQCYTTSVWEDFGEKETTGPLLVFEHQICCIVSIFLKFCICEYKTAQCLQVPPLWLPITGWSVRQWDWQKGTKVAGAFCDKAQGSGDSHWLWHLNGFALTWSHDQQ